MLHASTMSQFVHIARISKCPNLSITVARIYKCPNSSILHASTSVLTRPYCVHLQVLQLVHFECIYKCPNSSILHASTMYQFVHIAHIGYKCPNLTIIVARIYKCPNSSILHASTSVHVRPYCTHLQVS